MMLQIGLLRRVFHMRFRERSATCFAMDHAGRQYLVTARHCVKGIAERDTLEVWFDKEWRSLPVRLAGHARPEGVDISVLAPDFALVPPWGDLEFTMDGIVFGQEVRFLGYPYEMRGAAAFMGGLPPALVKRALLSAMSEDTADPILLDGHNNEGFSGGPVVFRAGAAPEKTRVGMVVSSIQDMHEPVRHYDGEESGMYVASNSGIIFAYNICHAVAVAEDNPIGASVSGQPVE